AHPGRLVPHPHRPRRVPLRHAQALRPRRVRRAILWGDPHPRRAGGRVRRPHRARGRPRHPVRSARGGRSRRGSTHARAPRDRGRGGPRGARPVKKRAPARAPGGFLRELKEVVLPSGPRPEEGLFLDRLTPTALERELEAAGIFTQLEGRGYSGFTLELDREDREHRLRVRAQGAETPLIELRASELTLVPKEPLLKKRGVDVLYLLAVHWLSLQ